MSCEPGESYERSASLRMANNSAAADGQIRKAASGLRIPYLLGDGGVRSFASTRFKDMGARFIQDEERDILRDNCY